MRALTDMSWLMLCSFCRSSDELVELTLGDDVLSESAIVWLKRSAGVG
jgi:hypothetical protein